MVDRGEARSGGDFSHWLRDMESALAGVADADVPCGGCTACCASSQFVHVGPEEKDALAAIPSEFLFRAPQRPKGHVLLGYDEEGRCPMVTDSGCSIYQHRPRACRTYDCRIFEATGLAPDDDKPLIVERAIQWQFDHRTADDRVLNAAAKAAAGYIGDHGAALPAELIPRNQTQLAVMAVEVHREFVDWGGEEIDLIVALRDGQARRFTHYSPRCLVED